ncbi:alpha-L-fucosidase-like [Watersipora subatra]|uniref:alpha-L-fucosidase-like n=1 Tax=Watersipora subatra TaxID=2589382 RepID=UPI00355AFAF1
MSKLLLLSLVLAVVYSVAFADVKYEPTWASIDSRPLPSWYDESKFGIFIHWGVFSVPSYVSEWFWWYWQGQSPPQFPEVIQFMKDNYRPDWTYADFANQFTAELYDPDHWADLFQASGAKYVVLTSKHHEGFTMWPSNYSFNWNAMQVGPKRDLVGDLAKSIRNRTDVKFGLYHSLFEWFNPLYLLDKEADFTTQKFSLGKSIPELHELVNTYKPEVIWSDGSSGPDYYWNSTLFLAWLYNESPVKDTVVTNDRWCTGCACQHGGYYTCTDRYNPGHLVNHKWENALTIDKRSWGYRRNSDISDYLSINDLITQLASTVSCGGNMLLNVGPTHDGRIMPVFEERLRQMGDWLKVNGEGIYSTVPWTVAQNDTLTKNVWYTSKKDASSSSGYAIYAIVLAWPDSGELPLGAPIATADTSVTMLGLTGGSLKMQRGSNGVNVIFPVLPVSKLPCKWAWTLKFINLKN